MIAFCQLRHSLAYGNADNMEGRNIDQGNKTN